MALRIRLSRGGAKKRPFHRIVVADSRAPRDGRFIERIGSYNPMVGKENPERIVLNEERFKHWVSVGAQPSDRVQRLASTLGICDMPSYPDQTKKNMPKAKTVERNQAKAEAAAAAAEAATDAVEAPAEETAEV